MAFKQTYNYNKVENKYPIPSSPVRHTVAFCEICGCQRTFSYGFCDSCNADYIDLKTALNVPEPVSNVFSVTSILKMGSPCVGEPVKERVI
jgi:hypothetical protein